MNVHKTRLIKNNSIIKVDAMGIRYPGPFCDIMSKKYGHVACIISIPCIDEPEEMILVKDGKEKIIWDSEGFPDIYLKNKKITYSAVKRGLKMLEKDEKNRFRYNLNNKDEMGLLK